MKKFNKNIIVFVLVSVFVIWGLAGDSFAEIFHHARLFFEGVSDGKEDPFGTFKEGVDESTTKYLRYHSQMMDLNSAKENLLGTRIMKKGDSYYVRAESGSIICPETSVTDADSMEKNVESVAQLQAAAQENGAKFLYCAAPPKGYYETLPQNISSYDKVNYDNYLSALSERDIPFIDLNKSLLSSGISEEDIFFYTDHHWKPHSGFAAAGSVCGELNRRYGFEYDSSVCDLDSYNAEVYKDWFLGSYGKKAGKNFSWVGADDFELITPKFDTDLTVEQINDDKLRTGSFEDTVLYKELFKKDYYKSNPYNVYSGGNSRLQIIRNNLNKDGKKVLIIRDSYAMVVTPFLALNTSELHICDVREMEKLTGDRMDMREYIKKVKPDYVLVLYTGSDGDDNRFDFFS